jgi:hypothetical protein
VWAGSYSYVTDLQLSLSRNREATRVALCASPVAVGFGKRAITGSLRVRLVFQSNKEKRSLRVRNGIKIRVAAAAGRISSGPCSAYARVVRLPSYNIYINGRGRVRVHGGPDKHDTTQLPQRRRVLASQQPPAAQPEPSHDRGRT